MTAVACESLGSEQKCETVGRYSLDVTLEAYEVTELSERELRRIVRKICVSKDWDHRNVSLRMRRCESN